MPLSCAFETALLARCAACEQARTGSSAAGESVECTSPLARTACVQLAGLLREKSAFALGLPSAAGRLSQARLARLQCGGLTGLKALLDPQASAPDVHRLVRRALDRYRDLETLPFPEIVQGIAAWRSHGRRRP